MVVDPSPAGGGVGRRDVASREWWVVVAYGWCARLRGVVVVRGGLTGGVALEQKWVGYPTPARGPHTPHPSHLDAREWYPTCSQGPTTHHTWWDVG